MPADVYSYAIVLWEIWHRQQPWTELKAIWDIRAAVEEGRRPTIDPSVPEHAASLMRRCWAQAPAARPLFPQILSDLQRAMRRNTIESNA
eukprot:m.140075 g.140075  ORF g.140075 m.140075 type:complete len:90 (-) comp10008_c0_seq1:64-333(-)